MFEQTNAHKLKVIIDPGEVRLSPNPVISFSSLARLTQAELLTLTTHLNQNGITLEDQLVDRHRDLLISQFAQWFPHHFDIGKTSLWGITITCNQINRAPYNNLRGGFTLRALLFNIFESIRIFRIHLQAENSERHRPLNQPVSIYYDAQQSITEVMLWLFNALRWINEVIRPLLTRLNGSEELLKYGARYMLSKNYGAELKISESSIEQCEKRVRDFLNKYIEEIQGVFQNQYPYAEPVGATKRPAFTHDLEKNIAKVQQLTLQTRLMSCYPPHDIATLIPISVDEICMLGSNRFVIKTHRNDSLLMGMIIGFVFHAQQELNQRSGQKPIFDTISAFFDHPFKENIADIINGFVFIKDLPSHRLKYANQNMSEAKTFINTIITKLRSELVRIRLADLERDLKNESSSLDNPQWSDMMLLFWHYYDSSVVKHDLQSYVCLDKTIKARVQAAVAHIKRLEQSGDKYVINTQKPSRLTLNGLLRLIAYLMVSAKNHSSINSDPLISFSSIIYEHTEIFSDIRLPELQEAFFYYFNAPTATSKVNHDTVFPHISDKMKQFIKRSVVHIKKYQSAGEELIVVHPATKILTSAGFQILRAHLSARKPTPVSEHHGAESASQIKSQGSSVINLMMSSATTFFSSVTQASSNTNPTHMELKPMSDRSPLLSTPATKDKVIPATHRGYGATSQTEIRATDENPLSIFTVDPKALEDFYVTRQDVETLGKELFKVPMVFIDKDKPKEKVQGDNQRTIYLLMENSYSVYFCFDPFRLCANDYITQKMITLSKSISSAVLSKQQISSIFKEFIKLGPRFDNPSEIRSITDDEILYATLARHIVIKCQQSESTVTDVINLMNAMQASINASKANTQKSIAWRAWREDFIIRLNFIYYFHYGKGYDQVQAINREQQCLDADKDNHAVARRSAQPG